MTSGRLITFGEGLGVLRSREAGSIAHASQLAVGTGGAESNVAIGVARLGERAVWFGRLGDDGLGVRVARELRAEGVAVHATIDSSAPTGLLLKESAGGGRTRVSYYRTGSAGSRITPDDLAALRDLDLGPSDVVHVTGITPALSATARASVDYAIDVARGSGATVSFDVNHRSRLWSADDAASAYRAIATRADILFGGVDELQLLLPGTSVAPSVIRSPRFDHISCCHFLVTAETDRVARGRTLG